MRLTNAEFNAMNGGIRRFLHRRIEFPALLRLGLGECAGKDVVELGCGNGFGAALIAGLGPRSYVGLDVMPEQIALADKRALAGMFPDKLHRFDDRGRFEILFHILHACRTIHLPCHSNSDSAANRTQVRDD